MKRKNLTWEANQKETPMAIFLASYNESVPAHFPRATAEALNQFRREHPILFKKGAGWSIDRHRKRLMDWLSSQQRLS